MPATFIKDDEGFKGLFPIGTLIHSRYEILSEGKMGGMGMVYKCRDTRHARHREVALKMMQPKLLDSKEAVERFRHEASISRDLLHHPNIVRVFHDDEWEDEDGTTWYYLLMEWIEGRNLRDVINERKRNNGPFSVLETQTIISQLADALAYAHSREEKVVHRDIKPENIIVTDEKTLSLKLADFGIAKILNFQELVQFQTPFGTSPYMSPEVKSGRGDADHRSDIYSVGVILYELLTLESTIGPFCPSEINKAVPKEIDSVYKKGVAPRAEQRYQDIKDLAADFSMQAEGKHTEWSESLTETLTQPREIERPSKKKWAKRCVFGALAALILAGAVGAFMTYQAWRREAGAGRPPPTVIQEAKRDTSSIVPVKETPKPVKEEPRRVEPQAEKKKLKEEDKWIDWKKLELRKTTLTKPKVTNKPSAHAVPPVVTENDLLPPPKAMTEYKAPVPVAPLAPVPQQPPVPWKSDNVPTAPDRHISPHMKPAPVTPVFPGTPPKDDGGRPSRRTSPANEHCTRGYRFMSAGDLRRAVDEFTRAIAIDSRHELSYYWRGLAYYKMSNFTGAIDDFTVLMGIRPSDAVYYRRGMAYYKLNNFYRAADDFTAAIRMKPGYMYHHWRGMTFYKLNDYYRAIDDFTAAIRMKPNELDYRWRGTCYQRIGRYMEADADFGMAARLRSGSPHTRLR